VFLDRFDRHLLHQRTDPRDHLHPQSRFVVAQRSLGHCVTLVWFRVALITTPCALLTDNIRTLHLLLRVCCYASLLLFARGSALWSRRCLLAARPGRAIATVLPLGHPPKAPGRSAALPPRIFVASLKGMGPRILLRD
jgi:hypothetical protein